MDWNNPHLPWIHDYDYGCRVRARFPPSPAPRSCDIVDWLLVGMSTRRLGSKVLGIEGKELICVEQSEKHYLLTRG